MKYLYLLVCLVCAVSISLLGVIYGTGRIPFGPTGKSDESEQVKPEPTGSEYLAALSGSDKAVEELIESIEKERVMLKEKAAELKKVESKIMAEKKMVSSLTLKMENVYDKMQENIIEFNDSESVNFKKMAEMCAKMSSENAAELLQKMEAERAARILTLLGDRQAAGILDASVSSGAKGVAAAAEWADTIRKIKNKKT